LIGDFNLPALDWSLDQPTPATNGGQLEESFCDLVADSFLQQFISGSTHVDGNKLDLLLCNCPEMYVCMYVCKLLFKSKKEKKTTLASSAAGWFP
jgi:hypothetical protein